MMDSSTRRRRDAEISAEKTNPVLAQFDGADDDGAFAGVGGVGREGSIHFELHEHFGAGRDLLGAFEIAGLGQGVGGEERLRLRSR